MKTRKDRRGGFSLAEVLIVIALLAILAAVAIPSILGHQRSLKLLELDDNARTIYLAAQNNLTAIRSASGQEMAVNGSTGRPATKVNDELYYVSTDDGSADWLVLPGSIDSALSNCKYLVEFDPTDGVVYGVFCAEDADLVGHYASLDASCRTRTGRESFAKSSGGFLVGYYGADGARPTSLRLPKPQLEPVINKEELVLRFKAVSDGAISADQIFYTVSISGPDSEGTTQSVTLVDKGKFISGKSNTVVLDTLKTDYSKTPGSNLVEGWEVGASFTSWSKAGDETPRIVPGADITLTVTTWHQPDAGEGIAALPQTSTVKVNSLFGQRAGDTVQVGYGRHLQNLREGADETVKKAVQVRDIDFAKTGGGERECWADVYPGQDFEPLRSSGRLTGFNGNGHLIYDLKMIEPKKSQKAGLFYELKGTKSAPVTVENVTLVDARIAQKMAMDGKRVVGALIGDAQNYVTVENCCAYITDPADKTTRIKANVAGGLIGSASNNITIRNCFASTIVEGARYAGGLLGECVKADSVTIERCYSASQVTAPVVGGLVSGRSIAIVRDCYASGILIVKGGSAGMSLGTDPETEEPITLDVDGVAGGLSPYLTKVTGSYAAVNILTEDNKDYHIYAIGRPGSYSSYEKAYYMAQPGMTYTGALDPATGEATPDVPGVTPVRDSAAMLKSGALTELGAAFAEGAGVEAESGVETHPYNLIPPAEGKEPLTAPYPYPALRYFSDGRTMPHYGDWLLYVPEPVSGRVAYYEQFLGPMGNTTEYICTVRGVEMTENWNSKRTGALYADGYAYLAEERLLDAAGNETNKPTLKVTLTCQDQDPEVKEKKEIDKEIELTATYLGALNDDLTPCTGGATPAYYAYAMPSEEFNEVPAGGFYMPIKVEAPYNENVEPTDAWFNPLFGYTAHNVTRPSSVSSSTIHIRSLRQLTGIGIYYGDNNYVQDLDIDAEIYVGDLMFDYTGEPIANAGKGQKNGHVTIAGYELWAPGTDMTWGYWTDTEHMPEVYRLCVSPIATHCSPGTSKGYTTITSFGGSYEGNGRLIRGLQIGTYYYTEDKSNFTGLFSKVLSATLRNINLEDCGVVCETGTNNGSVGMLAGRVTSGTTITNCHVKNCTVLATDASKEGGHFGGFIGYLDQGAVTLRNCSVEDGTVNAGTKGWNAGGFIGGVYALESGARIENCTVKNTKVSGSFDKPTTTNALKRGTAGGFIGVWNDKGGTAKNCNVIGGGGLEVSGKPAAYTGGFIGLMKASSASIENCGVYLEDKGFYYDGQTVSGGRYVGGFVGYLEGGTLTADHASVRVLGSSYTGGFAGVVATGTVSNCYAGGHTKNGAYAADTPNVSATAGQVGGLIGQWDGGTVDTCYTTCAVTGASENGTDVFANTGASKSAPNCYALGEVYLSTNAGFTGKPNDVGVATTMPRLEKVERTTTRSYDPTFNGRYPFQPVNYGGAHVIHYGDWPGTPEDAEFFPDWDTLPPKSKWTNGDDSIQCAWDEDYVYTRVEFGSYSPNEWYDATVTMGVNGSGRLSIITDLGYEYIFQLKRNDDGTYTVVGPDFIHVEHTWTGSTWVWEFAFPTNELPKYIDHFTLAFHDGNTVLDEVPTVSGAPVPDSRDKTFYGITPDGDFTDWEWYPRESLGYNAMDGSTALTVESAGSLYAEDYILYGHVVSEHPNFQGSNARNFLNTAFMNYNGAPYAVVNTDGTLTDINKDIWDPENGLYHLVLLRNPAGEGVTLEALKAGRDWDYFGDIYFLKSDGKTEMEFALDARKYEPDPIQAFVAPVRFYSLRGWPLEIYVENGSGRMPLHEVQP